VVRFLYCGQLIHRKGVDGLVRAFARVAAEHPRAELRLAGDGPLRAELEASVPPALRPRVRFLGFRQPAELPGVFADADVFVLPSLHDGWGVVVNQAVGAGMPVVASEAVGAAHDLVRPGENGAIFPAGDEDALAEALRRFAADPESVGPAGARSRERAADLLPERGAEQWHRICLDVLGRRDAPAAAEPTPHHAAGGHHG
jgi:glycosyltransferase involved in cell wall biosynthesis